MRVAMGDDVEPIAVRAIARDFEFVRREHDAALGCPDTLDFEEPKFARVQIEAGNVVAEILLMYVFHLTAKRFFVSHHNMHGGLFGDRVGTEVANVRRLAFRVG